MANRGLLVATVVGLLAGPVSPALPATRKPPNHRSPVELWTTFPLGKPAPRSKPKTNKPRAAEQKPAAVTPRTSAPAPAPSEQSPSASFPVAAVAGSTASAFALGLLAAVMLKRRRRGDARSPAVLGGPRLRPSHGPVSVRMIGHRNVDGSFIRRLQRATGDESPTHDLLTDEERQAFVAAVASSSVRWNTLVNQLSPPRRNFVSDGSQEQAVVLESSPRPDDGGTTSASEEPTAGPARMDIGERINEIIRTAEEAARQVGADAEGEAADTRAQAERDATARLAEAEHETHRLREEAGAYAAETRQVADSYATQKRREADGEAGRIQREAESQARAVREAAEAMAKQIEVEGQRKQSELQEETRAIEARLDKLVRGFREASSQLETLLQRSRSGDSLAEALSVDRHRVSAGKQEA